MTVRFLRENSPSVCAEGLFVILSTCGYSHEATYGLGGLIHAFYDIIRQVIDKKEVILWTVYFS